MSAHSAPLTTGPLLSLCIYLLTYACFWTQWRWIRYVHCFCEVSLKLWYLILKVGLSSVRGHPLLHRRWHCARTRTLECWRCSSNVGRKFDSFRQRAALGNRNSCLCTRATRLLPSCCCSMSSAQNGAASMAAWWRATIIFACLHSCSTIASNFGCRLVCLLLL